MESKTKRISGWTDTHCSRGHEWVAGRVTKTGARRCYTCERDNARGKPRKPYKKTRDQWLKNTYGFSVVEYDQMHQDQNGLCAICKQEEPRGLRVDHDHVTGKVRGLLCHKCNVGLGHFNDSPDLLFQASTYLAGNVLEIST